MGLECGDDAALAGAICNLDLGLWQLMQLVVTNYPQTICKPIKIEP